MNAISRHQRLASLEGKIKTAADSIHKNGLEIGRYLCEIRDDQLWSDEGFNSWNQYLKERAGELVSKSFSQAANLIKAADVEKRLPSSISPNVKTNLASQHLAELGRLAPTVGKEGRGAGKDFSQLRKTEVARVIRKATEIADSETPSVRDIRKAVDDELGINRKAEAKQLQAEIDEAEHPMLDDQLRRMRGTINGWLVLLEKVPADAWDLLQQNHPTVLVGLSASLQELVEFLES